MSAKIIKLTDAKQNQQAEKKGTPCPQCSQPAMRPHTPFCSRRCAQLDLGKWLNEDYRVPADDVMDEHDIDALVQALESHNDEP